LDGGEGVRMEEWQPIENAPRDGTRIRGRRSWADRWTGKLKYEKRLTYWGKTSHVPLYGWVFGRDVEDLDLWQPTHWRSVEPPK
jgi:hypothetical protein